QSAAGPVEWRKSVAERHSTQRWAETRDAVGLQEAVVLPCQRQPRAKDNQRWIQQGSKEIPQSGCQAIVPAGPVAITEKRINEFDDLPIQPAGAYQSGNA